MPLCSGADNRGKAIRGMLLLALSLLSCIVWADDREAVGRLLEKMSSAGQSLNYTGRFTFVNGGKSWTMRIVHSFDKHGEREYLTTIAGELRKVYRDDHSFVSIIPDRELLLMEERGDERSAAGVFDREFTADSDFYDYYLDGTEEIAGYTCKVVSIVPRDNYRFGYRLCLEAESGLLLKSQVMDRAGQPKEQLIFNRLDLPEKTPRIGFSAEAYYWLADEASEPEWLEPNTLDLLPRWKLGWVPPGFEVKEDRMRKVPGSATPVRHIVLDDGVASISVFIKQPAVTERYHASRESSGALNTVMSIKKGFVVAVLGEVPEATISAIHAGLKLEF